MLKQRVLTAVVLVAVLHNAIWAQEQTPARFDPFNPEPWLVGEQTLSGSTVRATSPTSAPTTLDPVPSDDNSTPIEPPARAGSPTVPGGPSPTKSIRLDIHYLDDIPVRSPYRP